jgi:hypothetical protein
MIRIKQITLVLMALLSSGSMALLAQTNVALKVVIIRHGEKPDSGDNLSCQGQYRALKLADVLTKQIGKPDFTYVPTIGTGKSHTTSVRMFQTVSPFAIKHNLIVNSTFKETKVTAAAADVLTRRGLVLMVWEHGNIPPLAKALGVPASQVPSKWKGHDFDSIWTVAFEQTATGDLQFLSFNTKGKEGIVPPACN